MEGQADTTDIVAFAQPVVVDDAVLGRRVFQASYNPEDIVQMRAALAAGGNPDWVDVARRDAFTALIKATCAGRNDMVELLLEAGADVNKASSYGCTPLVYGVGQGHLEVIRVLLEYGADLSIAAQTGQHKGHTAQSLAPAGSDIAELLQRAREGKLPLRHDATATGAPLVVEQTDEQKLFAAAMHVSLAAATAAAGPEAATPRAFAVWEFAAANDCARQDQLLAALARRLEAGPCPQLHQLRRRLHAAGNAVSDLTLLCASSPHDTAGILAFWRSTPHILWHLIWHMHIIMHAVENCSLYVFCLCCRRLLRTENTYTAGYLRQHPWKEFECGNKVTGDYKQLRLTPARSYSPRVFSLQAQ